MLPSDYVDDYLFEGNEVKKADAWNRWEAHRQLRISFLVSGHCAECIRGKTSRDRWKDLARTREEHVHRDSIWKQWNHCQHLVCYHHQAHPEPGCWMYLTMTVVSIYGWMWWTTMNLVSKDIAQCQGWVFWYFLWAVLAVECSKQTLFVHSDRNKEVLLACFLFEKCFFFFLCSNTFYNSVDEHSEIILYCPSISLSDVAHDKK